MTPKPTSELVVDIEGIYKTFYTSISKEEGSTVLSDINLKVHKGEFIAIIGKNGSGKTTLLKILAGIIKPTKGKIDIYSEMLAITDLGSGIVPDCTGYENIRMMGALYGVKGSELEDLIHSVKEFSELSEKLNLPVKHFSQGMYLRLAFSILVFLKLDLIVFDEVLAVGDISFRTKCLEHISSISKSGCTVIYVTHSFEEISDFCTRCILLENGRIRMDGDPELVYREYLSEAVHLSSRPALVADDFQYTEEDTLTIKNVKVKLGEEYKNKLHFNENFDIEIEWEKLTDAFGVTFTVFIHDVFGRNILSTSDTYGISKAEALRRASLEKGTYRDSVTIKGCFLNVGEYKIYISASVFKGLHDYTRAAISNVPLVIDMLANEELENEYAWNYSHSPIRMVGAFERQKLGINTVNL